MADKKVLLITGASRGIGEATAKALSGYNLAIFGRDQAKLQTLADNITAQGGKALVLVGDILNIDDIFRAVDQTLSEYGRIDVLINNAGIGSFKRVDEFSLAEFNEMLGVNLTGTFLFTKYVSPSLIKQKSGQIINVASVAGLNGFKTGTAYAASKFGMVGFTESLREDLKQFGIGVTVVCPGSVRTGFGDNIILKGQKEYLLEPEDVARTLKYLVEESETANAKMIELKPRRREEFRE